LAKLGEENLEAKKNHDAIKYLQEFFELMGRNYFPDLNHLIQPCYFNLALSYSNIADYSNSIKFWSKFLENDRTNFDAYFERMQTYFALNMFNEALLDIDHAIKLKPNRDDLYVNKGIAYLNMGNKMEARKAFSRAVEMGNRDAQKYIHDYC
jgi:tetratricopeptide (TPR) repeat protein